MVFLKNLLIETYIYNLINYYSIYIYLYSISNISKDKVILLFNYYLQFNYKFYAVYINDDMYLQIRNYVHIFRKKILQLFLLFLQFINQLT